MNTNQEQNGASRLNGNLLKLGDQREIAIYLRDNMAWVAEFNNGRASVSTASHWFSVNQGGRVLRQMDLTSIVPLPDDVMERIERLHQRLAQAGRHPATSSETATVVARFRSRLMKIFRSILSKRSARPRQTATSADRGYKDRSGLFSHSV
jgi:alkanesulfonate monooxygenase SsuD/methylene tetrahydromethanopterin reductase-like flavin-dependent oxidoreductase (luciferase family)